MVPYSTLSATQLDELHRSLLTQFQKLCANPLHLDLTRGNPAAKQLDIAADLWQLPLDDYHSPSGVDCRNYGHPKGLIELAEIFSPILSVPAENIIPCSHSSLDLMYNVLVASFFSTPLEAQKPWTQGETRFICPSPGYDRHFKLAESLGIKLIPVDEVKDGPDVDHIAELVATDPTIKGMWIVPIYSNPTGVTISEEKMHQLASMPTAAPDFRIFWDNAYCVHTFTDKPPVRDIYSACIAAGNPNRVYIFASTSKITFAGSGVSFFAASAANVNWFLAFRSQSIICPDKLNQLRHIKYLQSAENIQLIMQKHKEIIKPKFDKTIEIFDNTLTPTKTAQWTEPEGGYFIGLYTYPGTARKVVALAELCGLKLTPAGAAFPCGIDPRDEFIRLALTFVPLNDIPKAAQCICTCVLLAAVEKMITETQ